MTKIGFRSVPEYIAAQPRPVQRVLKQLRTVVRKAVPGADEVISYQIPAYKIDGATVIFFAGWKEHYSLYPANRRLVAAFKKELAPYEVNNKGTIRFPLDEPIPARLIDAIVRFRAEEAAAESKPRATRRAPARRRNVRR
jgi:uncharacterized protein YdhG (YjbR/CyaY superfamily)